MAQAKIAAWTVWVGVGGSMGKARERQIILKTNQCNILNEMGREENSPHSQAVGTRAGSFPRGRQRGRGLERPQDDDPSARRPPPETAPVEHYSPTE